MKDELAAINSQLALCKRLQAMVMGTSEQDALEAYRAELEAKLEAATASTTGLLSPSD